MALAAGLVDEIDDEIKAVALCGQDYALKHFNIPAQFAGVISRQNKGNTMGLFGKTKETPEAFAAKSIQAMGFGDDLQTALESGNENWLKDVVMQEHQEACQDLQKGFQAQIDKIQSAVASCGVKIDTSEFTPEKLKEQIESTVSARVAQMASEQGIGKPLAQGASGETGPQLKGRDRLHQAMVKQAEQYGIGKKV